VIARVVMTFALLLLSAPVFAGSFAAQWLEMVQAERAVSAKDVRANADRSYPPSCLSYPLPTQPRGEVITRSMTLADVDGNASGSNGSQGYFENVTVTIWRAACSGGTGALLVRFARPANRVGTLPAPDIPAPYGTRGTVQNRVLRPVIEPNTYFSEVIGHSLIGYSTLVLDAIPTLGFDLNAAFTLSLDTVSGNNVVRSNFSVPTYNAAAHPDNSLAMELTGYVSGSWFDPAKSGEGLIVEIGERANGSRIAAFAWYTYDTQGNPAWIVGNMDIANGLRTVTIPALYVRGGGFAGAFDPATLNGQAWGTVTLTFPNCNALTLGFASTHAIAGAPAGTGTRNWVRALGINGLTCQ